jgi:hypothetical protein
MALACPQIERRAALAGDKVLQRKEMRCSQIDNMDVVSDAR